jgi:hypothetical protein
LTLLIWGLGWRIDSRNIQVQCIKASPMGTSKNHT